MELEREQEQQDQQVEQVEQVELKIAFCLSHVIDSTAESNPTNKNIGILLPEDLKRIFDIDTDNLDRVILLPGSTFRKILQECNERTESWPNKVLITTPIKLIRAAENSKNKYSYHFYLPHNDEKEIQKILYDVKEKDWVNHLEENAGTLPHGQYKHTQLSLNHYYLPLLRLKKPPSKEGQEGKREANWFAEGFLDLTPGGQKIPTFDSFREEFGENFDEGVLEFICRKNKLIRKMVPSEPPRKEEEIIRRNAKQARIVQIVAQIRAIQGQNAMNIEGDQNQEGEGVNQREEEDGGAIEQEEGEGDNLLEDELFADLIFNEVDMMGPLEGSEGNEVIALGQVRS